MPQARSFQGVKDDFQVGPHRLSGQRNALPVYNQHQLRQSGDGRSPGCQGPVGDRATAGALPGSGSVNRWE